MRQYISALRSAGRLRAAQTLPRAYATISPDTPPPQSPYEVFDEPSKVRQRDRAILRLREEYNRLPDKSKYASVNDYLRSVDGLREELAERLVERVEDLKTPPQRILELSSHAGQLTRVLQETLSEDESREWYMVEPSELSLNRDQDFPLPVTRIQTSPSHFLTHPQIAPLREKVDAVVSTSGLHWVGDIVGGLTQVRHVLKPDGVFIAAVLGGDTLFELRTALQLAEQERRGGIANRISPMINPTDGPSLLNRAGFTTTTVDIEEITINYPSMWELLSDLRDTGESNAILGRRGMISRDVLLAAEGIYRELYQKEEDSIPATFQVIFMIGWKPGPTEPKPLPRGSGQTNLKDILQ